MNKQKSYYSSNDWLTNEPVYKVVLFMVVMLVAAGVIKIWSLFERR